MCGLVMSVSVQAQNYTSTEEKYERYFESKMEMDFRKYALKSLDLNSEEIKDFDPLFREYMNKRVDLAETKVDLAENYRDEIAEKDTRKKESREATNFIEDYWAESINELDLKRQYFSRFSKAISYEKALKFFLLEDEIEYQILRQTLAEINPYIMKVHMIFEPAEKMKSSKSESDWDNK
jgi:tyrosyl-tRNA synthetase